MRIIDLETINQAMNNETQFVLRCEEVFHDKVSSAASAILSGGRWSSGRKKLSMLSRHTFPPRFSR